MGIRSIIEDALGYVTPEDREAFHRKEQEFARERAEAQQGAMSTLGKQGVGTALSLGEHMMQSKMTGEATADSQARRSASRRVTRTIEEHVQDADELEM